MVGRRRKAIDHQRRRLARGHLPAQQMQQTRQPIFFQRVEATDIEDAVADRSFIVKFQVSDIQQHPTDSLGDQRHVQNLASRRSLIEANLIPENRLADSGRSFDDIQTASEEAAV